jgi:hypothetical protein
MELKQFDHLPRMKVGRSGHLISVKSKDLILTELAEVDFSPGAFEGK